MLKNLDKAPFPYAGGKSKAAPAIWAALGDVEHYVEPFAGSLACLLLRPHEANRPYHSETVNDADGLLVNAWRSIQLRPDETAEHASNPVMEADLHARHSALVRWRAEGQLEHLMGDPEFCDPRMAGWWIWGVSCWIGHGFASGVGPWIVDPRGFLARRPGGAGVWRKLPHISDDGRGVNHAAAREPGVSRQLPHLGNDGRGVNRPVAREPGVGEEEFHPVTMPEIRRWFAYLSARLRHVRVLNGDWARAVTTGASHTLSVRKGGVCGYFLDPPYSEAADRADGLYGVDGTDVAPKVLEWCKARGFDPKNRIVLAGFDGEHNDLEQLGWRSVEWFEAGYLSGGMGNTARSKTGAEGKQQRRERLWLSPFCLHGAP